MKLTSSIRPVIRLDKEKLDGTCPIHFSLRVGNHVTRIPTGKYIAPKDWDNKNNGPKKNTPHGLLLATYLIKKMSDYNYFILEQQSLGKQITLNIAMEHFNENAKVDLFSFWEQQQTMWVSTKSENTLKSYQSTLRILKLFNKKLNFGDLTLQLIQKFDSHMRNERNNATNGCFVKHKCLKSMINQAIMHGYMTENPYRYFKNRSTPGTRKFLSIEEIKVLMQPEQHEASQMQKLVKDLFLFSCFTGLRYSDLMQLKMKNLTRIVSS